jgi:hypothetical protein
MKLIAKVACLIIFTSSTLAYRLFYDDIDLYAQSIENPALPYAYYLEDRELYSRSLDHNHHDDDNDDNDAPLSPLTVRNYRPLEEYEILAALAKRWREDETFPRASLSRRGRVGGATYPPPIDPRIYSGLAKGMRGLTALSKEKKHSGATNEAKERKSKTQEAPMSSGRQFNHPSW